MIDSSDQSRSKPSIQLSISMEKYYPTINIMSLNIHDSKGYQLISSDLRSIMNTCQKDRNGDVEFKIVNLSIVPDIKQNIYIEKYRDISFRIQNRHCLRECVSVILKGYGSPSIKLTDENNLPLERIDKFTMLVEAPLKSNPLSGIMLSGKMLINFFLGMFITVSGFILYCSKR